MFPVATSGVYLYHRACLFELDRKIKQAAKPKITAAQLKKAKEYVAAGGKVEAIESKYKITDEQRKDITKA